MDNDQQLVLPLAEVAKALAYYLYARYKLPAGASFSLHIEGQALVVELVPPVSAPGNPTPSAGQVPRTQDLEPTPPLPGAD